MLTLKKAPHNTLSLRPVFIPYKLQSLQESQSFSSFFSYITIVVNLYGTAHEKNNQLYNYFAFGFFFFFFFCFGFLCLLAGVLNLYSTGYFFSYIIIIVNLYGTAYEKKKKNCFWFLCLQHISIYINIYKYIFCFWLLCLLLFLICTVLVILFYFFLYNHCC
jgi:hypothetical protein